MMTIAILALQGAFFEHQQMFEKLGAATCLIRNLNDWQALLSSSSTESLALCLPGGESTAMMKIMHDEGLLEPIRNAIRNGLPTFGTCAGMILLDKQHLDCMDITVRRNAYGRQLGSFHIMGDFRGITDEAKGQLPMTFIRAPYIERCGQQVEVLAMHDGHIIAARQVHMLVCSFHPELTTDTRIHQFFLSITEEKALHAPAARPKSSERLMEMK